MRRVIAAVIAGGVVLGFLAVEVALIAAIQRLVDRSGSFDLLIAGALALIAAGGPLFALVVIRRRERASAES